MKVLAKILRSQMTDAERLLWQHLRASRLDGFKFRRQVVIEPYIVDFVCLEAKLVVEADGGQHGEQHAYDSRRSDYLEARGYRVLRFWNHEILTQTWNVLEEIHRALIQSPHPNPSPRGRGA
jgi:adenine-specific DNA-methyltransferase